MNITKLLCIACLLLISKVCFGHGDDDPLLWTTNFDELALGEKSYQTIDNDTWLGRDLEKLWLKTKIERIDNKTESAEFQALYTKAIRPNWDLQMGLRQDFRSPQEHTWAVLGIQGLAPYYIEIDSAIFLGDRGRVAARIEAEYDILFTQKLILSPGIEFNFFGQNEKESASGSGFSNAEFDLQLRYHFKREFAPYLSFIWEKSYGNTAKFRRALGRETAETRWVLGIKLWL